jgi:hypothetical protein
MMLSTLYPIYYILSHLHALTLFACKLMNLNLVNDPRSIWSGAGAFHQFEKNDAVTFLPDQLVYFLKIDFDSYN